MARFPQSVLFTSLILIGSSSSYFQNDLSHLQLPARIIDNQDFQAPDNLKQNLQIRGGERLLVSGGLANPLPRAFQALQLPIMASFEAQTLKVRSEIQEGLRYVFQTKNVVTLALHGTGSTAIDAVLDNLIEPGDKIVLGTGHWGQVAAKQAARLGANVTFLSTVPGTKLTLTEIEAAVRLHRPKILYLVNGLSSTGVFQPIEGVGKLCRVHGCLSVIDVVASVGQVPIRMDEWMIDVLLMNSHKALGAIVGLAPVSFSPRAFQALLNRKTLSRVHAYDIISQATSWATNATTPARIASVNSNSLPLFYSLREGVSGIVQEGIENVWKRHELTRIFFHENVQRLGYQFFVPKAEDRLTGTTTFKIPEGKDVFKMESYILRNFAVDVSPGSGETIGKVLRVGLFGNNGRIEAAKRVLEALKSAMESPETNL